MLRRRSMAASLRGEIEAVPATALARFFLPWRGKGSRNTCSGRGPDALARADRAARRCRGFRRRRWSRPSSPAACADYSPRCSRRGLHRSRRRHVPRVGQGSSARWRRLGHAGSRGPRASASRIRRRRCGHRRGTRSCSTCSPWVGRCSSGTSPARLPGSRQQGTHHRSVGPGLDRARHQRHPRSVARGPRRTGARPAPVRTRRTCRRADLDADDRRPLVVVARPATPIRPDAAMPCAEALLDRHGIVTRGAVVASERTAGGFAAAYPVLKAASKRPAAAVAATSSKVSAERSSRSAPPSTGCAACRLREHSSWQPRTRPTPTARPCAGPTMTAGTAQEESPALLSSSWTASCASTSNAAASPFCHGRRIRR